MYGQQQGKGDAVPAASGFSLPQLSQILWIIGGASRALAKMTLVAKYIHSCKQVGQEN